MEKLKAFKVPIFGLIFISLLFSYMIVSPPPGYCGWRDSVNNSMNSMKKSAIQNSRKHTSRVRKKMDRTRQTAVNKARQTQKKAVDRIQRGKKISSKRYQKKIQNVNKKYRQSVKAGSGYYNKQKNSVRKLGTKTYSNIKSKTGSVVRQSKNKISNRSRRIKKSGSRYIQQSKKSISKIESRTYSNLNKRIDRAKIYGKGTKQFLKKSVTRLGNRTGATVVHYIEKTKGAGTLAVKKSMPLIQRVSRKIHDPVLKQRVTAGVLVAAGTGLAVYKNRDDIQYVVLNQTIKNVKVPVNGRMQSIDTIYRDAVLQHVPYLKGTDIAEDPAKMLAYGVASTAKEDLLNNIDLMPDGKGGLISINDSVVNATGANEGLAALQVGDALEGIAVDAATNGKIGYEAQVFATAYANANAQIGSGVQ